MLLGIRLEMTLNEVAMILYVVDIYYYTIIDDSWRITVTKQHPKCPHPYSIAGSPLRVADLFGK